MNEENVKSKRVPWNKGLTKETDERVKKNVEHAQKTKSKRTYVAWNKGLTKETDPRVKSTAGELNPMYGKHTKAWNKGLTKDSDERMKKASDAHKGVIPWNKGVHVEGHPQSEESKKKISEAHLSVEFKQKHFETMKLNGTLGINSGTVAELEVYNKLVEKYGNENIVKQYFDKDRYPYRCDFYIPSEDLFIEVHGNWTHGKHPFDSNNEDDLKVLQKWQEKAKTSNYYKNAIYTWTDLDVRKQKCAKDNNLNYQVIYYNYKN